MALPLVQRKDIALGQALPSFAPGFVAYGIIIDNDTGNWLLITPGNYIVPPWTYGWSQPLNGTQSVSLALLPGPTIIPSINAGTFVRLTITEERVPQSNGFTAVIGANITSAISIVGPVTVTGTVGVSGLVDVSGSNVNAAITNAVTITGAVTITSGTVAIGGTVDVSGSTVTASISNIVTITGSVAITSGTVSISGAISIGTITAGNVNVNPGTFTLGGNGVTVIAVTGTRLQLKVASTPTQVVMIKARSVNSGIIYVGTATVTNNETAGTGGLQLEPGDMVVLPATNLNVIYINGTATDGVSYMYWT